MRQEAQPRAPNRAGVNACDLIWFWATRPDVLRADIGIAGDSAYTAARAAADFGVPNLVMAGQIALCGEEQAAVAGARRVIWELNFEPGHDFRRDLAMIRHLAERYANVQGLLLDDMTTTEFQRGLRPAVLMRLREAAHAGPRPLQVLGVVYTMNLDTPHLADYLVHLDAISLWVWQARDLTDLDAHVARCQALAPGKPIHLGAYLYDFGEGRPMPVELMRLQCERALEWARAGRIAGLWLLPTCLLDAPLEAVEWTQQWLASVEE